MGKKISNLKYIKSYIAIGGKGFLVIAGDTRLV